MKLCVRSLLKTPIPHSPTTPETASSRPTIALRRQRGSPNNSPNEPALRVVFPAATAAFQASGSRSFLTTITAKSAGRTPTQNIHRHWLAMTFRDQSSIMPKETTPAPTLPAAENACSMPSDCERAPSGRLSATRAQPTGKMPPAPSPVTKHQRQ